MTTHETRIIFLCHIDYIKRLINRILATFCSYNNLEKKALLHDGGGAGDGGAVKEVVDQSVVCGQGLER